MERKSRPEPMGAGRWQQVCQVFAQAVAQQGESRQRHLDLACGGDAGLRGLVEDLLARDEAAVRGGLAFLLDLGEDREPSRGSLPSSPPAGPILTTEENPSLKRSDESKTVPHQDSTEVESPAEGAGVGALAEAVARWTAGFFPPEGTDDLAAQPIPGYRIVARLGEGGMGVVFKAEHLALKRFVALKMMRGDTMFRPEHLARFRVEAEAIARLRHPHVVDIYEVGEAAGSPYCALELLEGGTLAQRLAQASLPPRQAAELLATIASAVHSAHRVGIVHRDLKPANVLFDADGTAKVADFGLAKRLEIEDGQTQTGHILGTPSYMAPEQARGRHREVGPAADIYALGATLYEMLTGRPPFKGTSHSETLMMVLSQDPVPPSRLQPRLPRDLETICLKCLAKEPARRYASAEALADDLQRFLGNRSILARPTPAWERSLQWSRRRPMTTAAAAFAVAVIVGLAALGLWVDAVEKSRLAGVWSGALADFERARTEREEQRLGEAVSTLRGLVARLKSEPSLSDLARIAESQRADLDRRLSASAHRDQNARRIAELTQLRNQAMALEAERWLAGLTDSKGPCAERVRDARLALQRALDAYRAPGSEDLASSLTARQLADLESGGALVVMALAESIASPLPGEQPARQAEAALHVLEQVGAQRAGQAGYRLRRAVYLERAGKVAADPAANAPVKTSDWADQVVQGQEWARRGDWDQARLHLAQAFESGPAPSWYHGMVAIANLNGKNPRLDVARSEMSIGLQDRGAGAWMALVRGLAYARLCETVAVAGRITISSRSGLIKTVGQDRTVVREWAEAAAADFRAAEAGGLDAHLRPGMHIARGKLRLQGNRVVEAEADFAAAIAMLKGQALPHVLRAEALRLLNRREEAIAEIDRAITLEPATAAYHRARAELRLVEQADLDRDQAELALHDLETAARLETRATAASAIHVQRARLLAKLQRHPEVLQAAEAAIAAEPGRVEAHLLKVAALLELGKHQALKAACDAALVLPCPADSGAQLHRLRGLALVGQGQFHEGILDYTRALDLAPRMVEARTDRGWAYLLIGAVTEACKDFDEAIRLADRKAQGYSGRAAVRVELDNLADAFDDVRKAVELDGASPQVHYNAARVFARAAGKNGHSRTLEQRADEALREAYRRTPPQRRERFKEALRKDPFMQPLLKGRPALLTAVGLAAANR